jgi:hypothetical protein
MKLTSPVIITPRLLPGLHIGDTFVSIEFGNETSDERIRYHYYLDGPDWSHESDDLTSGVGGGSLQEGLSSLLSFLGAFAEAIQYSTNGRESENLDLFPEHVRDWASANSDEIGMLSCELEETPSLIAE